MGHPHNGLFKAPRSHVEPRNPGLVPPGIRVSEILALRRFGRVSPVNQLIRSAECQAALSSNVPDHGGSAPKMIQRKGTGHPVPGS